VSCRLQWARSQLELVCCRPCQPLRACSQDCLQGADVAADKALVGTPHPNVAAWQASTSYSADYQAKTGCGGPAHPRYGVQDNRVVNAGETCGGAAGLGGGNETEYATKYPAHAVQVCSMLPVQCYIGHECLWLRAHKQTWCRWPCAPDAAMEQCAKAFDRTRGNFAGSRCGSGQSAGWSVSAQ
jgi:hypothetical protein